MGNRRNFELLPILFTCISKLKRVITFFFVNWREERYINIGQSEDDQSHFATKKLQVLFARLGKNLP